MPEQVHQIDVDGEGVLTFVYADELADLCAAGEPTIRRASHVEPDANGKWYADLSSVGGPKLGPFDVRGQAIEEEVKWLHGNRWRVPA